MLLRFLAVGGAGLAVDAATFSAAFAAGVPLTVARALSLGLATIVTWRLNRRFTFQASGRAAHLEGLRYALVALGAQGFNWGLFVTLCRSVPGVPALVLLVASAACATTFSFAGQRLLTFSRATPRRVPARSQ
jgi:putative flippase GtrA